jgi:hypothetical protein
VGNICLASLFAMWSGPVANLGAWLLQVAAKVPDEAIRGYVVLALITAFALAIATVVHFAIERPATAVFRGILDAAGASFRAWRGRGVVHTIR